VIRPDVRAQFMALMEIADQSDSDVTTVVARDEAGNIMLAAVLAVDEDAERLLEWMEDA